MVDKLSARQDGEESRMRATRTSTKFGISAAPDLKEATVSIEDSKSDKEFDEYLADLLTKRALRYRYRDPAILRKLREQLLPQVKSVVNKALIECICSPRPTFNHELPRPKNPIYKREDTISMRVRSLVAMIYPSAHKEFIRQKTTGCMITIEYSVGRLDIPYVA